jgi:hypothetical protein
MISSKSMTFEPKKKRGKKSTQLEQSMLFENRGFQNGCLDIRSR